MSTPHPDTQILMFKEMLERSYQFHIGDVVEINSEMEMGHHGVEATIRYPYYYLTDEEQTYITNITPVPYKDSELRLVRKNPNGEEETRLYLENWIKEANSITSRKKYVHV